MIETYSVAEARAQLPKILRRVEKGKAVEITRRGKPVAMLVEVSEYSRLKPKRKSIFADLDAFRKEHQIDKYGFTRRELKNLRDRRDTGREFHW